jgi:hypothetical protein
MSDAIEPDEEAELEKALRQPPDSADMLAKYYRRIAGRYADGSFYRRLYEKAAVDLEPGGKYRKDTAHDH